MQIRWRQWSETESILKIQNKEMRNSLCSILISFLILNVLFFCGSEEFLRKNTDLRRSKA